MTVIIFLIVLAVLILVHEFGHFIIAKKSGIRVDEFGLGFPPRVWGYKPKGSETTYTINWIPFGGFVKIFGENPDDESINGPDKERSFVHKGKHIQAAVLVGGVFFNLLFAWLLYSIGFFGGMPTAVPEEPGKVYSDESSIIISLVTPGSPAEEAGLLPGDEILALSNNSATLGRKELSSEGIQSMIAQSDEEGVSLELFRDGESVHVDLLPEAGIVEDQKAIGIAFARVEIEKYGVFGSIWQGLQRTVNLTGAIAVGLVDFLWQVVTGNANFDQVAGPVGIAGLVGDAARVGIIELLVFTAFISINLAVLNMLPFPALDGGRLLFVLIEKIKGSPINPKVANTVNLVGFGLLLLLMLIVTVKDIGRLF